MTEIIQEADVPIEQDNDYDELTDEEDELTFDVDEFEEETTTETD